MPEAARVTEITKRPRRQGLAPVIPMPEPSARPQDVADFAASLKALSNYEVWKNVESAVLAPRPPQDKAELDSWRFRLLLDELQWRHSGLEGAGKIADIDKAIAEAHEIQ
jgi:hypothetical protein